MTTLAQLLVSFEELWPEGLAEEWDAPGLLLGNPDQTVNKIVLSVDATAETVAYAAESGAQLLFTHHPYLMRGAKLLPETTAKGSLVATAIRSGLAIFSAHTNADVVANGVSVALANALGITTTQPIVPRVPGSAIGVGAIGLLANPISVGEFARSVAAALPHTAFGVVVAGDYNQMIERVAVCGGAGDSYIGAAAAAGAEVYLTADLRHHIVQDAREQAALGNDSPVLIGVSHWASEFIWLETAAAQLRNIYPGLDIEICDLRTDPWDFAITQ